MSSIELNIASEVERIDPASFPTAGDFVERMRAQAQVIREYHGDSENQNVQGAITALQMLSEAFRGHSSPVITQATSRIIELCRASIGG